MMKTKQGSAFITTKKGFCYLTIKDARRNYLILRVRQYTITPEEKRHMRRLYPDILFDWKNITAQLAEKREVCAGIAPRGAPLPVDVSRSTASLILSPVRSSSMTRPISRGPERC